MQFHPARPLQGGSCCVIIDVNWRPVFWDDEAAAKAAVLQYIQQADILKVTDEASAGRSCVDAGGPAVPHGASCRPRPAAVCQPICCALPCRAEPHPS